MLRLMAVAESAGFTLSRITGFQVAATYDGNMSAVASAVPERRLEKTEDCPLSETLSGHIDDSGLVVAFTAHGGHAENQFVQVCLSRSDLVDRK